MGFRRVLSHLNEKKTNHLSLISKNMFKDNNLLKSIIIQAVYYKFRFGLSYRDIEKLMVIRGVKVDHASIQNDGFLSLYQC